MRKINESLKWLFVLKVAFLIRSIFALILSFSSMKGVNFILVYCLECCWCTKQVSLHMWWFGNLYHLIKVHVEFDGLVVLIVEQTTDEINCVVDFNANVNSEPRKKTSAKEVRTLAYTYTVERVNRKDFLNLLYILQTNKHVQPHKYQLLTSHTKVYSL